MLNHLRTLTFACVLFAAAVLPVSAQVRGRPLRPTTPPNVWIAINGGYQATTTEFDQSFTFDLNREQGDTRVTYPVDAGVLFDGGVGVRLWRGLGAGVAVSRFVRDGTASTTTRLPHPFFFNQPREITGDADITREETGIHVQALYALPLSGSLQVVLSGGPSFLDVNQTLVERVNYTEEYPYDTATFTGVDTERANASAIGFNVGADVKWMFTRNVGVGGMVRFTKATVDLDAPNGGALSIDAGGAQAGAGIRFAF